MRADPGFISKAFSVLVSCAALAVAMSPAALAERRKAPIVYGNAGETSVPAQPAKTSARPKDKATSRIEFRYPDQPETYYSAEGTKSAAGAGPVAFVSADSALTTAEARVISKSANPVTSGLEANRDPALSPGAFDARAAAASSVREPSPVAEFALEPMPVRKREPSTSQPVSGAETVLAIVYGDEFDGLPTANGEIFNQAELTAAHPTLALPSRVLVLNPATGREVIVRVNDRGPFEDGATLQVSRETARALGFDGAGQAELTLRVPDADSAEPAKARSKPKSILAKAAPAEMEDTELLGGDELAGAAAPASKARVPVKWPEPPAEWGAASPVMKASASAGGTHFVQLASFSDIGNAEAMYRGLKADLPVEIVPARVNGADYFRVRVGPLDNRNTAQELRDRLDAEGKGDGRVVTAE